MESLNHIVQRYVEARRQFFEGRHIAVEFALYHDMPEIYEGFTVRLSLTKALAQLNLEVVDAKPTKVRYQTSYEGQVQRLAISHNGNPIPQESLDFLNGFLDDIYEGRREWHDLRHGNLIAGQAFKEYDGRLRLENIDENGYRVRTTLELPASSPTS